MANVLLTGFGPFGHTPINPAESVARALDGQSIGGATVVSKIVPCEFFECIEFTKGAIDEIEPTLTVMMGEYGGRSMITVERLAQNLSDSARYGLADNVGKAQNGQPIVVDGPAACYATMPIRAMVAAMRQSGIPADISDAPGTNLCNHLMYGVLHYLAETRPAVRAGWIHLPHLPSTAALEGNLGAPSMSIETAARGVTIAINAALEHDVDIDDPIRSRWQI
jgi:pyroglutamyl-peptidase